MNNWVKVMQIVGGVVVGFLKSFLLLFLFLFFFMFDTRRPHYRRRWY